MIPEYEKRIALLTIPFFLIIIAALAILNNTTVFEPPLLLPLMNTVFLGLFPLFIALIAFRTYRMSGSLSVLLLGSGMLVFGLGSIAAGWLNGLPGGANITPTIHNISVCIGSVFSLAAVLLVYSGPGSGMKDRSVLLPSVVYGVLAASVAVLCIAAVQGYIPPFFIQGTGPTVIRQVILSNATELYALTAVLLFFLYLRKKDDFFFWFSIALALIAIGLLAVFIQPAVGSLIGWAGRCAQYAGAVFFLIAMMAARREATREGIPLTDQINRFIGNGEATHAILSATKESIWLFSPGGTILMANPTAMERLAKGSVADIIGHHFSEFMAPGPASQRGARLEEVIRTRKQVRFEEEHDGIIFDHTFYPVLGREGEVTGIAAFSRDITGQKQAEEALLAAHERTAAILEQITDTFYSLDNQWRFTLVNPSAEEAPFGRPASELIGRVIWDLYPGLVGTPIHRHYLDAAEKHALEHYEAKSPLNSRWYEVFMQGRKGGVDVYMRDITKRKKAEDELRQRQAEIQALFDNIPAGLVLFSGTAPYTVLVHNRYYQEFFSEPFRSRGMVGLNVHEYAPAVEASGVVAVFDEVARTKEPHNILDFPYNSNPPHESWFNWYMSPIILDGNVVALVSMSLDVTDRHRAEYALRESEEKYRGLFENIQESVAVYRLVYDEKGEAVDRVFVDANPKAIGEMGYRKREDIIGKPYSEVVLRHFPGDQKSIDLHLRSLAEVARSGKPITYDTHFGDRTYITTQYPVNRDLVASSSIEITLRKHAEEALRESEMQLRRAQDLLDSITKSTGVMIAAEDTEFRYTYFNKAYADKIKNLTGKELTLGMSMVELFAHIPAEQENSLNQWKKVLGGKSINQTIPFENPGSEPIIFNVFHTPIRDNAGTVIGAGEVSYDVTRQIQTSDELRHTSQYLENLINYANAPIIVWDPEFRITLFNRAFEHLTDWTAAEVIGQPFEILLPRGCMAEVMELIRKTVTGERWESVEIPILHRKGGIRTVLWNSSSIYGADGKTIVSIIAQGQDITDRKKIESEYRLRASEYAKMNVALEEEVRQRKESDATLKKTLSLLNASLESTADGICVVDQLGTITGYNQNFMSMWDIPSVLLESGENEKVINSVLPQLKDPKGFLASIRELRTNPGRESFDMIEFADGKIFERYSKPQKIGDSVVGRVWSYRDITDRKHAEQKLVASLQEKEVLLREIHHRVKNNLQLISGLLDMTRMRTGDESTNEILTDMMLKIQTMAQIHTRLYESKQFGKVSLTGQIRDQIDGLSNIYSHKGHEISCEINSDEIFLPVDQAIPCALVINEILSNAYKHAFKGRKKGTIGISVMQENGRISITVRDDGIGLPADFDISRTNSLGLKLIRTLISHQLKGSFTLTSRDGTEMSMEFPVMTAGT
jgi:PAS domain S-box-containing protein